MKPLKKIGYKFRPRLDLADDGIRQALRLALPMLVSTWVQPLYSVVNTRIASGEDGIVSVLNCSNRLYLVMTGVFSFVVTNLVFPRLSRTNAAEDKDASRALVAGALKAVTIVILPIMVCFILLSEDVIGIIYEHGLFTREQTLITAAALSCYSVGMIGLAYNEVLSKSFFSMKNSRTPLVTALLSMAANIAMAYIFYGRLSAAGLALATAGGSMVNALLNLIAYRRSCGRIFTSADMREVLKLILCAAVMCAAVAAVAAALRGRVPAGLVGYIVHGAVCGAVGLVVYFGAALAVGVDSIKNALGGIFGEK